MPFFFSNVIMWMCSSSLFPCHECPFARVVSEIYWFHFFEPRAAFVLLNVTNREIVTRDLFKDAFYVKRIVL